jgi:predicted transcriptional regulator
LNRRNILEISADVLRVAKNGVTKTCIVNKSNLNFKIAKKYLERLTDAGLIKGPIGDNNIFLTTPKGINYLRQFTSLQNFLEESILRPSNIR